MPPPGPYLDAFLQWSAGHETVAAAAIGASIALVGSVLVAVPSTVVAVYTVRRSATAALEAARLQGEIQRDVADLDFKARVTAASGQRWMDTVRDHIAEMMQLLEGTSAASAHMSTDLRKIRLLMFQVRLLLSPDKPDHKTVNETFERAYQSAMGSPDGQVSPTYWRDLEAVALPAVQRILKDAWRKMADRQSN
jgi:hypothetical protein